MAGYIGNKAVGLNVTTGDILGDVGVGGDIDVDGTANLDVVDIDGAVDMASTLQLDGAITLGVAGASNGFINSPSGIFVNIDSDNNQTDRFFDVRKNSTDGSGTLLFQVVETGAATIANGLTLTDGNLVVASGHGIDFAATGNGGVSTPSELLDDYEEGSWTPIFAASNYTFQYNSTTAGKYVRVGKLVHLNGYIRLSHTPGGSGTATLVISQLPFTISNTDNSSYSAGALVIEGSGSFFSGTPAIRPNKGSTNIGLFNVIAGASPTLQREPSNLTSGMEFEFQVTYHV